VYPSFLVKGDGAYVYDYEGERYVDFPCALGAILLGYAYPYVNEAIINQLRTGTTFSLPHFREGELAERIQQLVPSAEQCRFLKTGSEACSAAVKIARAYTGRDKVLSIGYHGWHDWYSASTPKSAGSPSILKRMCVDVAYNDTSWFDQMDAKCAAIILEPYMYDAPKDGFLEKLIAAAKRNSVVVVFDEVITGLRTPTGSAQVLYGITPDLSCFGKAFGNGAPISVVCGRKDLMQVIAGDCFVSSTFGGDLIGISAALATLDVWHRFGVADRIGEAGYQLKRTFNARTMSMGMKAACDGQNCRTRFNFEKPEHKWYFWQECLKRGVLFGEAQFTMLAHNQSVISTVCAVMEEVLELLRQHYEDTTSVLEGKQYRQGVRDQTETPDNGTVRTGEVVAAGSTGVVENGLSAD
jgi:glutamate-1-semialdehyde aminotransferase